MGICDKCKKEHLLTLDCRCGKIFCIKHKDPLKHKCSFNYHENKEKLIKNNPKVVGEKLNKI